MVPLTLAVGDTGVRKATAYSWSISTGTAGDFGLVIVRRLAEIPFTLINAGQALDFAALGMPRVYDNACLALAVLCSTTNTGQLQGSVLLGEG